MMPEELGPSRGSNHRFRRIDRDDPAPLYKQLEDILREEIERGRFEVGALMPSEGELCATWNVSRSVVRQALSSLALHGVIRTEKGRGSFVAEQKVNQTFVQRTTGFFDDLNRIGLHIETRVVRQEIVEVTGEAAEFLGVDRALEIARVRSVEGRVLTFVRTYLVPGECPGLEDESLDDLSLYAVLEQKYGITIHAGTRTIEAVLADGEVSRQLEVATGSPLLLLRSAGRDADGRPVEWFDAWHRADRTRFELAITPETPVVPLQHQVVPFVSDMTEPHARPAGVPSQTLGDAPIIVALDDVLTQEAMALAADVVCSAGARLLALPAIPSIRSEDLESLRTGRPGLLVGMGSVNSADSASHALGLGADFLLSDVAVELALHGGDTTPVLLGGATATEIRLAWDTTRMPVLVNTGGGSALFEDFTRLLPGVPLLARLRSGDRRVAEYLDAGARGVVLSASLSDLRDAEFGDVVRAAIAAVQ